ncbi:LOW QUALITY PROTEIN: hypothetical protein Cgig2_023617 [Carnegiea gigantea]|uniref:Uncharacterized protein n=1 Tax=Carnegiea gigantea TaxID=171969 RepID=A0A9Q1KC77_9CARY|nr:LOW QUALITY PROTEIN: hypothetical protein Cgig2_023617 [Carnegiea gigantea]
MNAWRHVAAPNSMPHRIIFGRGRPGVWEGIGNEHVIVNEKRHCKIRGKYGVNHGKHSVMNRETDSSGVGDAYYVGVRSRRVIGKIVDPYSDTSMVRRLVEMDGDGVAAGGSGDGREVVVYVLWGVSWTNDGGGKVTYVGGWTKCIVLKEDMGLEEVKEITGNPRADFDANYEGDIVEVEDLLDGSYVPSR